MAPAALTVHEKNYLNHDLELVAEVFVLKDDTIIFMVFMWNCESITRLLGTCSVRKILILGNKGCLWGLPAILRRCIDLQDYDFD